MALLNFIEGALERQVSFISNVLLSYKVSFNSADERHQVQYQYSQVAVIHNVVTTLIH